MKEKALIELHYLPSLAYFSLFLQYSMVLDAHEHVEKQSYRNRSHIHTSSGLGALIVPMVHEKEKIPISQIRIDFGQKWQKNHWGAIQSAYGKAPFFEFYGGELRECLFSAPSFLFELNLNLLSLCLKWLKLDASPAFSERYHEKGNFPGNDLRNQIHPKNDETWNQYYHPQPYIQVFGNKFASNLSLMDLIFCQGPEALAILREGVRSEKKLKNI